MPQRSSIHMSQAQQIFEFPPQFHIRKSRRIYRASWTEFCGYLISFIFSPVFQFSLHADVKNVPQSWTSVWRMRINSSCNLQLATIFQVCGQFVYSLPFPFASTENEWKARENCVRIFYPSVCINEWLIDLTEWLNDGQLASFPFSVSISVSDQNDFNHLIKVCICN